MNTEIVDRLQRSLENDRVIGGPIVEDAALIGIAKMIASAMHDAGRHAAFTSSFSVDGTINWYANPYAYDQAVRAANAILEAFRPAGEVTGSQNAFAGREELAAMFENLGVGFANGILEEVARGASRTGNVEHIGRVGGICRDLGKLRDRIRSHAVGPETTNKAVWGSKKRGGKK
jgi:hypothetical protein